MNSGITQNLNQGDRVMIINFDHIHTITGPKSKADEHFENHGVALWIRGNGSARLFYTNEAGRKCQKTWSASQVVVERSS